VEEIKYHISFHPNAHFFVTFQAQFYVLILSKAIWKIYKFDVKL